MLRLTTNKAAPGMVIALPVLHPQKPEHVLLKPGVRLDHEMVAALAELRVPALWIDFPPTSYLLQYASPAIMAEHGRLAARLGDCFDRVADGVKADFEFSLYTDSVRSLVHKLVDDPVAAVFMQGLVEAGNPLLTHSANVCYLSLLMGLKLDGYLVAQRSRLNPRRAQNVENLGVGAMFHDLGLLRVDPAVAAKWWATFDENDAAWRRHTLLGFEMLRGKVAPTSAGVVLHHHQRLDGSGFPRKSKPGIAPRSLRGEDIHIFARIVAVADEFSRAQMNRAAEGALGIPSTFVPTVRALRNVLDQVRTGRLDPVVFRALLAVTPVYAPGSVIELNDGRTCVVTEWDPSQPCSPTVRPLLGTDAISERPLLGAPIELANISSLHIAHVEGHNVSHDNFYPGKIGYGPMARGEFDPQSTPDGLAAGMGAAFNDAA